MKSECSGWSVERESVERKSVERKSVRAWSVATMPSRSTLHALRSDAPTLPAPDARQRKSAAAGGADGFVLIMVLVVVLLASMVVTSLMFVLTAEQMAAAAGNSGEQARATAMSGLYRALRAAAEADPGSTEWQDNPAVFRDQLVCDDGAQKWYF